VEPTVKNAHLQAYALTALTVVSLFLSTFTKESVTLFALMDRTIFLRTFAEIVMLLVPLVQKDHILIVLHVHLTLFLVHLLIVNLYAAQGHIKMRVYA